MVKFQDTLINPDLVVTARILLSVEGNYPMIYVYLNNDVIHQECFKDSTLEEAKKRKTELDEELDRILY
jgi:hypothetical protein